MRPVRGDDGYYTFDDGTKLLSVTNIKKGGIPLDLSGWAGFKTGELAMESLPKLLTARGEQARKQMALWLGQVNLRIMAEARDLGVDVHNAIEAQIHGEEIPPLTASELLYWEAYQNFVEIEQPQFVAAELRVANFEDAWAGTVDCYLFLPRRKPGLYVVDWKTTRKVRSEVALQLAPYQRATVAWLKDGTQIDAPVAEHAAVIHLRPDTYEDVGYRIVPMDTSDEIYQCFLHARHIAIEWDRRLSKVARKRALKVLERTDG